MAGTDAIVSGRPRAWSKASRVAFLALLLILAAVACGGDVDRESYIAANDAVLAEVPIYPSATLSRRADIAYDAGTLSLTRPDIIGYETALDYDVQASSAEIDQFFRRELSESGWGLIDAQLSLLRFTKGNAGIRIGWATTDRSDIPPPSEVLHYMLNVALDHNEFRNFSPPTMPPDAPPAPTPDQGPVPPAKQTAIAAAATAEARQDQ